MLNQILQNIYLTPIIGVFIGWIIIYLYNKIEKKNYSKTDYFKFSILIYLLCLLVIYFSNNNNKILNLSNPDELLTSTIPIATIVASNVASLINKNDIINDETTTEIFNIGTPNF